MPESGYSNQHRENPVQVLGISINDREVKNRVTQVFFVQVCQDGLAESQSLKGKDTVRTDTKLVGNNVGLRIDTLGLGSWGLLHESQLKCEASRTEAL